MASFLLTAKINIPVDNGMKIPKGQTFVVNLPFTGLPFDSIKSRDAVVKILSLNNYEVKNHWTCLSGAFFDYKKI